MEALQRAIADACLGEHADLELVNDLGGFLLRRGVASEDIEAILASPRRLPVYRSLVRNGISSVVVRLLRRTRARMNAIRPGRFDADLAAFVDQAGPRTHYLREVPEEFFVWVEARWRADPHLPAYLPDLAAHELAHFAVGTAQAATAGAAAEVALDRGLAFVDSAKLARHRWAVHELGPEEESGGAMDQPARRDVTLLAYRDATHAVRWLELTPLAGRMIERLLAGEALGAAVSAACADCGASPASVLPEVARLLSDLGARGVVVGALPDP
jgi:hypothetical protein